MGKKKAESGTTVTGTRSSSRVKKVPQRLIDGDEDRKRKIIDSDEESEEEVKKPAKKVAKKEPKKKAEPKKKPKKEESEDEEEESEEEKKETKKKKETKAKAKAAPKKAAPKKETTKKKKEESEDEEEEEESEEESEEKSEEKSEESEDDKKKKKKGESEDDKKKKKKGGKPKKKNRTPKAFNAHAVTKLTKAQQDELESLSVQEIKDRLRANDQKCTGTKGELLGMVAEFVKNGALPKCPSCFGGKLTLATNGSVFCKGFYDDDHFVTCYFYAETIERSKWVPADGKLI